MSNYSEVPNRRADWNKRAGLKKSPTLLAYLLSKLINEQGGNFHLLHEKIASRVERKSEKSKRACSSIRDFRVLLDQLAPGRLDKEQRLLGNLE